MMSQTAEHRLCREEGMGEVRKEDIWGPDQKDISSSLSQEGHTGQQSRKKVFF